MASKALVAQPVDFTEALSERYLAYALSTITSRSLPDVRDGLKPVHRRLLYAMLQLKLDPSNGYKKCARVVGDVIGKYHPHGDTAVYDTMVRLAQQFAVRYPLVDGQGNFGSVDGDNAAAMRYTEARLTPVAMALLEGIREDTVPFQPTYDGEDSEPLVMPASFPNLLANGAEGIAVGMATSIPPHNMGELLDACLHIIKTPDCRDDTLLNYVKGPDFPTGGILIDDPEGMRHAYETGKGAFKIRAKYEVEKLSHGMWQVVVTEIPYQVQKSRMLEKLAELYRAKKLPLLGNIRDESAEDIRLILEPKNKNVDPAVMMASLFKVSELETRFNMNMNVLTARGVPQVLNLKQVLEAFLSHRMEILERRSKFRLDQIAHRLEILSGFLIAYLNLDEVIHIIRTMDKPKAKLIERFKLTEVQAEAILNMRLRQLRKLEEIEIQKEHDALSQEQKELQALLQDETWRWSRISDELKETKKKFGQKTELGKRRTIVTEVEIIEDIGAEAFIEKEPITVLCSKMGWIRAMKGHSSELLDAKHKEGDEAAFQLNAYTTDKLLMFASDGRSFTLPADDLPGGKGYGEPVRLMVDLDGSEQIIDLHVYHPKGRMLVAADNGKGFVVAESDMLASTKSGKNILNLKAGSKALICVPVVETDDHLAVIGNNRKLLVFPLDQIPEMKRGQGVTLQKYKDAKLSDARPFKWEDGLGWSLGDRVRHEDKEAMMGWLGNRAAVGKLPPNGFPKSNKFNS